MQNDLMIEHQTSVFSVTGQITAEDLTKIKELGFKTVICNRPDSEEGAVDHKSMAAKAAELGLHYHYLPVVSGAITDKDVSNMQKLLAESDGSVLAYCRSGGRCKNLFAQVQSLESSAG